MYKQILVPIDGSPQSDKAEIRAIELANLSGAEITFLHVIIPMTQYFAFSGEGPLPITREIMVETEKAGSRLLKEHVNRYADSGLKISEKLIWGHPADIICTTAKEAGYDLIVMGSRGYGSIKGYLLGSVSDRVSHHASCSVLIVH